MKHSQTPFRHKLLTALILLLAGCLGTANTQATHLDGGSISYTHNGNSNYTIRLELYQDCFSYSQAPFTPTSTVAVVVRNRCELNLISVPVQRTDTLAQVLPNKCGTALNRCNGGTLRGLRKYVWEGLVNLPVSTDSTCNEWELTWGVNEQLGFCCHTTNNTLSQVPNGAGPGQVNFFLRAYLNNNFSAGNTTGQLGLINTPFFCVQYPVWMNVEQGEPEGDSLHYALVPALTGYETPAYYQNHRSATQPMATANGVQLDEHTGDIRFQPTQASVGNFVLRRNEFRSGVLIGFTELTFKVLVGTGAYCNYPEDTVAVLACDSFVLPNDSTVFAPGSYQSWVGSLNACDTIRNFNVQLLQSPPADSLAGERLVRPFSTHTYAVVQPDANFQYRFEVTGASAVTLSAFQADVVWGEAGAGEVQLYKYADSSCGRQLVIPIDINTTARVADVSLAELRIFPNPAKQWLQLEGLSQVALVRLFDLKGGLVMELVPEGSAMKLDLQALPPGMYTLAVHGQASVRYEKLVLVP